MSLLEIRLSVFIFGLISYDPLKLSPSSFGKQILLFEHPGLIQNDILAADAKSQFVNLKQIVTKAIKTGQQPCWKN